MLLILASIWSMSATSIAVAASRAYCFDGGEVNNR